MVTTHCILEMTNYRYTPNYEYFMSFLTKNAKYARNTTIDFDPAIVIAKWSLSTKKWFNFLVLNFLL